MTRTRKLIAKKLIRAGHTRIAGRKTHKWMRDARFVRPGWGVSVPMSDPVMASD